MDWIDSECYINFNSDTDQEQIDQEFSRAKALRVRVAETDKFMIETRVYEYPRNKVKRTVVYNICNPYHWKWQVTEDEGMIKYMRMLYLYQYGNYP